MILLPNQNSAYMCVVPLHSHRSSRGQARQPDAMVKASDQATVGLSSINDRQDAYKLYKMAHFLCSTPDARHTKHRYIGLTHYIVQVV